MPWTYTSDQTVTVMPILLCEQYYQRPSLDYQEHIEISITLRDHVRDIIERAVVMIPE